MVYIESIISACGKLLAATILVQLQVAPTTTYALLLLHYLCLPVSLVARQLSLPRSASATIAHCLARGQKVTLWTY